MLLGSAPAFAQTGNPGLDSPGEALSRNLRSLAENPKSLHALMGAGKAALELGDPQTAITFFGRAEEQAPRDGRIKMWLGASLVQLSQAQGALKFFAEAISLGAPEAEVAGARGVAYDLLGDPRRASALPAGAASKPSAESPAISLCRWRSAASASRRCRRWRALLIRDRAAEVPRVRARADRHAQGAAPPSSHRPAQSAALTPFLEGSRRHAVGNGRLLHLAISRAAPATCRCRRPTFTRRSMRTHHPRGRPMRPDGARPPGPRRRPLRRGQPAVQPHASPLCRRRSPPAARTQLRW